LDNSKFVANAPPEVVAKEQQKLTDLQGSVAKLTNKHDAIAAMT